MGKILASCAVGLLAAFSSAQAAARGPSDVINIFQNLMRGAIRDHARKKWAKIPSEEASCVEQELRLQGHSLGILIQNGVLPNDPAIADIRSRCRSSDASLPLTDENLADARPLSTKPTFDCTKARTATARIVCLDSAGAEADWDLASATWARYFSLSKSARDNFDKGERRWLESLNRACRLRGDQTTFALRQTRCVLTAYRRRAARHRSQLAGDALAESRLSPEEHVEIQEALIALGFLDDTADGEFGPLTRAAINRFQVQYGFPQSEFLSEQQRQQLLHGAPQTETAAIVSRETERPQSPPVDTLKLKEARAFLEDAKQFIADQQEVPNVSAIAEEAANLQIAVDKFDEPAAVQSMEKLGGLLKALPGFIDFEQQAIANRRRDEARQLAEAKAEATKNIVFIDGYLRDHLGDPETPVWTKLREEINSAIHKSRFDEIKKANDDLKAQVDKTGLSKEYEDSKKPPKVSPNEGAKTLAERLGLSEKSKFLVEGPASDIVLLYNVSPTAPNVWRNIRGDIVFERDAAALCFAQTSPDHALVRYIERTLGDQGARNLASTTEPCDLSTAPEKIDVIAFHRNELLKSRENYILAFVKLIERDAFQKYEIISDYESQFQKRQALALEIERGLEANERKGYGVIFIAGTESPTVCVITPERSERVDGLKELLQRNRRDIIAPKLKSSWNFVETTADLALRGLQRKQCGYVAGEDGGLRAIMLALRRDQILKYEFSAVWWNEEEVDRATFDVRDQRQQEIRKQALREQEVRNQQALEEQREKEKQEQKTEIEKKLRQQNGVTARALKQDIHDFVKKLAEQRLGVTGYRFKGYSSWLDGRVADKWETYDVSSEVEDFGKVQWENRSLNAIIVKTVIQQKNRILGKYDDQCFMFGYVDDSEFQMIRKDFAVYCSDVYFVNKWKAGLAFQSQWNAN